MAAVVQKVGNAILQLNPILFISYWIDIYPQRQNGIISHGKGKKKFKTLSRFFEFIENVKCKRISPEFLGTALKFTKRKKNSWSLVNVLRET